MEVKFNKTKVKVIQGDITELDSDAIVNAANNRLWMGAGVAGAIKKKGGKSIEDEATKKGPIPVGEAVATGAGNLKSKYVIHAAVMGQDLKTDDVKIRNATINSLLRAEELGLKSIAFPAIGCGVGGFPYKRCAEIMIEEVKKICSGKTGVQEVIFVLFGEEAFEAFKNVAKELGK